jgi:hypothetical protein
MNKYDSFTSIYLNFSIKRKELIILPKTCPAVQPVPAAISCELDVSFSAAGHLLLPFALVAGAIVKFIDTILVCTSDMLCYS